jgi:hypothetical protein
MINAELHNLRCYDSWLKAGESLKFSRLVQRPGLKRDHPFRPQGMKGGSARVYSKVLVEENKKNC